MRDTTASGRVTPSLQLNIPQRPIDWDEKVEIARHILGAFSPGDFVEKVLPGKKTEVVKIGPSMEISREQLRKKCKDAYRKWGKKQGEESLPRNPEYHYFLDELARMLGCAPAVKGYHVITAPLAEFVGFLPQVTQDALRKQHDTVTPANPTSGTIPFILIPHGGKFETIRTGVRKKQIDTAHYYAEPEAAESWNRLILAEEYPTYDQCKAGLNELVKREAWNVALKDAEVRAAVMLAGGGAPTKDLVILRSVLKHAPAPARVSMFLVDTSDYMLQNSLSWLNNGLPAVAGGDRIDIQLINDNVLSLRQLRATFRREGGGVLFAITGGTIGNLKEGAFFRAVERVANEGDILIVSADTVDPDAAQETEQELRAKYKNPEMLAFIASGVNKVMQELNLGDTLRAVLDTIEPRISRAAGGFSEVPGSWSVRLVLPTDSDEVTLVSSTRYVTANLISFASAYGWRSICTVPSPLNPHFVQFAFRKTAENAGT